MSTVRHQKRRPPDVLIHLVLSGCLASCAPGRALSPAGRPLAAADAPELAAVALNQPAVGSLVTEEPKNAVCTGALVAPAIVLTAAHCFNCESGSSKVHGVFRIKRAQVIIAEVPIKQYWSLPQPSCRAGNKVDYSVRRDIALVELATGVSWVRPAFVAERLPPDTAPVMICGNSRDRLCDGMAWVRDRNATLRPSDSGGPVLYRSVEGAWDTIFAIASAYTTNYDINGDAFSESPDWRNEIDAKVREWTGSDLARPPAPAYRGKPGIQRMIGVATTVAGAMAQLGSIVPGLMAAAKWDQAHTSHCDHTAGFYACDSQGVALGKEAGDFATASEATFIIGTGIALAGAILWTLGSTVLVETPRPPSSRSQAAGRGAEE